MFLAIMEFSNTQDVPRAHQRVKDMNYQSLDRDENWMLIQTNLADIAVCSGDREMGKWLYDALLPYASLIAIHDLLRVG